MKQHNMRQWAFLGGFWIKEMHQIFLTHTSYYKIGNQQTHNYIRNFEGTEGTVEDTAGTGVYIYKGCNTPKISIP